MTALPRLRYLSVSQTGIGNRGLRHLLQAKELEHLSISKTQVGGEGAAVLKNMPKLLTLSLSENQSGQDELNAPRAAKPNLKFFFR